MHRTDARQSSAADLGISGAHSPVALRSSTSTAERKGPRAHLIILTTSPPPPPLSRAACPAASRRVRARRHTRRDPPPAAGMQVVAGAERRRGREVKLNAGPPRAPDRRPCRCGAGSVRGGGVRVGAAFWKILRWCGGVRLRSLRWGFFFC